MTKVKLKDATRELLKGAEETLSKLSGMRKSADALAQLAKKQENQFAREEERRRAEEKQAEQERLLSQHAKAFTMPDTDDEPKPAAAPAAPAPKTEEKPVEKAPVKAEKPETPEKPAAPAKTEAPEPKKETPPAPKAEAKPAPAEAPKAKEEKKEPAPAPVKQEEKQPVQKPEEKQKVQEEKKPAPAAAPQTAKEPAVKPEKPVQAAPAPAQPAGGKPAPQQHAAPAQPAAARPAAQKPAPPSQQAPRPMQQQARPVPQQGARPAGNGPRPAGPYGRPANPQGPYGRPANPQGPYGRPANPQGPYGRPANSQGPYGRPANPQGGAQRPVGGFGRPAGGGNRPPMGGGRSKPAPDLAPVMEKERVSNYDPNKKNYVRQHDPERVAKNRKQLARDQFNGFDDDVVRGGRRARVKKPSAQQLMAPIKIEKASMTAETITVKDLTERIGKPAGEILKKLLMLGVMANINSELDYDTASLVCSDFGVTLELNLAKTAEDDLKETDFEDNEEDLVTRPPVVTIMGHVDHGKTSLLDYIRHSHVTAGEAGGITQHIGAYTVTIDGRVITFLDTPGHEAFTAMRARGAMCTDIAVLVVAADDGVMPQTVEAINHAKAAEVPIIVAINKMDKPGASPERIKQDLTNYGLVCEDWGGDTIMVPVSALTGEGVDNLLEMILLEADVRELRANPNRLAKGVIIEAKLDKARGPLATVLLQNGTLHVGDNVVAGLASGRVRAMVNDKGERVKSAGPSMPVEISGFTDVPSAGDEMMAVEDDRLGRQVVEERRDKLKAARVASSAKVSLDNLFSRIDQSKMTTLNLIVKADVQGSVEAVKQALEKLSNDQVRVRVLHSAVGAVTKDDVNLASAFDAIIIGFNIRPDNNAKEAAEREGVDIRLYRVIYQAIEDIEKAMKGLLAPEYKEVLLGHAEVRNTFRITGAGTVAGCYVQDGKMQRNAQVRLLRDNIVVFEGKLNSLKRFKDDAKEVAAGYECGISFDGYNDIKEGDVIECFIMEEIER